MILPASLGLQKARPVSGRYSAGAMRTSLCWRSHGRFWPQTSGSALHHPVLALLRVFQPHHCTGLQTVIFLTSPVRGTSYCQNKCLGFVLLCIPGGVGCKEELLKLDLLMKRFKISLSVERRNYGGSASSLENTEWCKEKLSPPTFPPAQIQPLG